MSSFRRTSSTSSSGSAGPGSGPVGPGLPGIPDQPPSDPSDDMPLPPPIGRPDGLAASVKDAPETVRDGVMVWYAVAAIQLLTGVIQLVLTLTDRRVLTRQVVLQTKDMDLPSGVTITNLVTGYALLQFLLTIISVGVCIWLISRVGRGGYRSRFILTLGSVYLAAMALLQAFATAPETGSTTLIVLVGAGTIISGVLAPVGWWFLSRPETRDWFGIPSERELAEFGAALDRRSADLKRQRLEEKKKSKADGAEKNPDGKKGPHDPKDQTGRSTWGRWGK